MLSVVHSTKKMYKVSFTVKRYLKYHSYDTNPEGWGASTLCVTHISKKYVKLHSHGIIVISIGNHYVKRHSHYKAVSFTR